jgi:hypothetical protein
VQAPSLLRHRESLDLILPQQQQVELLEAELLEAELPARLAQVVVPLP